MPSAIQTNSSALDVRRYLGEATKAVERSYERLSSGYRINSAADDAAGLSVSETLTTQIRAYQAAERNARNAIGMSQTAESSLSQVGDILIRMRELSVQAANGDVSGTDRGMIDNEFQSLKDEIDRLAKSTKFNGRDILGGSTTVYDFQVGINGTSSDLISVTFGGLSVSSIGLSTASVAGTDRAAAVAAIDLVDLALTAVNSQRTALGVAQNRLTTSEASVQTLRTNLLAARSLVRDADIAAETSQLARGQVLMQAGTSILAQANVQPKMALSLLGGA
ncbi:MAG: flagellin FliC [Alphaproteobacteria bacterium]|nr:flagellin FliC [Alphaproteobacteria bacterium]